MGSSADASARRAALRELGAYVASAEAEKVARALEAGEGLSSALSLIAPARRGELEQLIQRVGLWHEPVRLVELLLAVAGARAAGSTRIEPLWTMPGHLAQGGPLTSSMPSLVRGATTSVVCSTYNFADSSDLWRALAEVAGRPGLSVRLYLDTQAAEPKHGYTTPSLSDVACHLAPGHVFRTRSYEGAAVRNHAKFVVVDHRFLLVTSANFSYSAAYRNVELGVRIDDEGLAGSVEREIERVEDVLYERVVPGE